MGSSCWGKSIYFKRVSGDWGAPVGDEQRYGWGRDQVQDCTIPFYTEHRNCSKSRSGIRKKKCGTKYRHGCLI